MRLLHDWGWELLAWFLVIVMFAATANGQTCPPGSRCVPGQCGNQFGGWRESGSSILPPWTRAHQGVGNAYGPRRGQVHISPGQGVGAGVWGPRGGGAEVRIKRVQPQRPTNRWAVPCLVRLTSPRSGPSGWSGILLYVDGGTGYVATSSHNFPDDEANQTVATLWDGRRFRCRLIGRDDQADAVLLGMSVSGLVRPTATGNNPTRGTGIVVCGFGGGRVQYDRATVTGIAAPGGTDRWEWFSFEPATAAEGGDSGGPILSTDGRIVGMVSGEGTGVGVSILKSLLANATGPEPEPYHPENPGETPGPGTCDPPPRPVVPVRCDENARAIAKLQAADAAMLASLKQHSEVIRKNTEDITAIVTLAADHEGRIAALEGPQLLPPTSELFKVDELTDAQVVAFAERLPPVVVRIQDGSEVFQQSKRLGEPIHIHVQGLLQAETGESP